MKAQKHTKNLLAGFAGLLLVGILLPTRCLAQTVGAETVYQAALPGYSDNSSQPLNSSVVSSGTYSESTWQKISYAGASGPVPGLLFLPIGASAAKPVPCLILLHGLGGSKEQMVPVARFFASIGYASWAIDDAGAGERAAAPGAVPQYPDLHALESNVDSQIKTTVVDQRRGIDYLSSRPEIDQAHIGEVGFSLGSIIGVLVASVDSRVSAIVVISGGGNLGQIMVDEAKSNVEFGKTYQSLLIGADPAAIESSLAEIDPVNFVAHVSPRPLLMEHGQLDKIVPPDAAQALYDAAQQPKQIVWYPNDGHIPSPLELYPSVSVFLDKYLPVAGR